MIGDRASVLIAEAEKVARCFHEAYERLAPNHGYETREASRTDWENVPEENRALMQETALSLLRTGVIRTPELDAARFKVRDEIRRQMSVEIFSHPGASVPPEMVDQRLIDRWGYVKGGEGEEQA